jgi:hypothetical protein
MPQNPITVQIKNVFDSLAGEKRNAVKAVKELCVIASQVQRFECYVDARETVHAIVDDIEVFQWKVEGSRGNFRNFLSVLLVFAEQYAERSATPEVSIYGINCLLNASEFGEQQYLRLRSVNTTDEQRFEFSRID